MPVEYHFPIDRIRTTLIDPTREPLVLVACGSFSPVTHLHLRMFELAADYARHSTNFELIGGYFSPVSDAYKKEGLAPAKHRLNMVRKACEETSDRWDVDPWEASRKEYTPTAAVLDHFDEEINIKMGGIDASPASGESEPKKRRVKIMLLAGSDLLKTMSDEGVWDAKDLNHILGNYGAFIVERMGADIKKATSALSAWSNNIYQVEQTVLNDVSSTKVRLLLRKEYSVRYLLPESVVDYIEENGLYSRNVRINSTNVPAVAAPTEENGEPSRPNWERLYKEITK
ncbi:Nicotinamide mononucleotide adenylyl transferase [Taphrina deformans PYCC 5710]|uniref:Nicotinamide-nucleotide adenylyltransferase n=1 Tax=Taphrina deformans (strain PYCC 5710 / ATCC 11124 / CBS 356.35 / IMI 108563 / JCM 9778 / NBRC 8474) TaxID=1097556 RepID=R5A1L0_TAPDE|nr:Nicotinamide mononucleotide adenylyl transferase [Taphrina deformans PYCC 5710]|eukprot:CCX35402.1 Nicotinamide mononucleotide adenylyl transferase [Taphrina deformans PYCC 5710]